MNKVKKMTIISTFILLIIILFISTNPTTQDYLLYQDWKEISNPHIQIERKNFYLFSAYTPIVAHEHGMTHLVLMGNFYQISDGQFDYPWWLNFFN